MKKMLMALAMVPVVALAKTSTPEGFTDNLDEAFAAAKASGKYVYACFSGSDWCGWCKKLDKEVFAQKEFLDGVTNDYVLVFIDSPSDQSVLSEHAKRENKKLTEKYEIEGFPTALIFSPDGEKITQTGYQKGGPAPYVKYLMGVRRDGPNLRKRAEAEEAFFAPYGKRVDEMMKTVRKECDEAVKVPLAKARQTLDGIIRDLEAAQVSDDLAEKRDEFIEKLKGMKKMFKGED